MWEKFLGVYVVLALVALAMAPTDAVSQMCESTEGSPQSARSQRSSTSVSLQLSTRRISERRQEQILVPCVGFSSAWTSLPIPLAEYLFNSRGPSSIGVG